jgi:anti-sigma regulatory factor (Ser/Thr protein kinase)
MKLSDIFTGIAYKRLVLVDLPNKGSHQHELNGSLKLTKVLGSEKSKGAIRWMYFSDANEPSGHDGEFTWYDSREKSSAQTGRSEWRFYYKGGFLSRARVGDILIIAKLKDGVTLGLLFANPSKWLTKAMGLLGVAGNQSSTLQILDHLELAGREISVEDPLLPLLGVAATLHSKQIQKGEKIVQVELPISDTKKAANPNDAYKIRPAGRHILTIGRDLIQDSYAAVVELVKNAYDADSPDVSIEFKASADRKRYTICIEDHGHGMSRDTVINKWMVPSTDDKLSRKTSPNGRTMQGRKGIGRYAASILGADLLLETTTPKGEKTTVYVEWKTFESAQYLDDVEILIETQKSTQSAGTRLTIAGDRELLSEWNSRQFDKLRFELKKLMSPASITVAENKKGKKFQISIVLDSFLENQKEIIRETIEPFPIFELFDYRIAGRIGADGKGSLTYSLQKIRNTTEEKIHFDSGSPTGCGELVFDIRVYDREKESIDVLIRRGLKDESDKYVSNLQARQLLNEVNGIGVYRNGFRIRPLGDADFDWLKLNEQRVQNFSLRISSNQAVGYVQIESEEQSDLVEKSARDGLKENVAFEKLKQITTAVIGKLEERRFEYRKKAGLSRPVLKVERELERLFAFDELKQGIRARLKKSGIDSKAADEIIEIISKEEEEKNKIAEEIRQAVAVYQGQATLGKIINVILHEGRRPLNYFKNQIPNLNYWYDAYVKSSDIEKIKHFLPIAEGVGHNAEVFVQLFSRLDPLAAGRRTPKKPLPLIKTITDAFAVFKNEMEMHKISLTIDGPKDFNFMGWLQDIYSIFTNLADNTIYWMKEKKPTSAKLKFPSL